MTHKYLFVGISVVVLFLLATTPVWGEKCKQVVIGQTKLESFVYGPENCDGYDGCATSKVSGTFSGTLTESFFEDDVYHVVDDTYAFTNYGVIETTQGTLFFRERSIVDFEAPDGGAVVMNVLGGTGRYESATDWMAYHDNLSATATTWGGEVCWPDGD